MKCRIYLFLGGLCVSVLACQPDSESPSATHMTLVCLGEGAVGCSAEERQSHLKRWEQLSKAGTFTVWSGGGTRKQVRRHFKTCIQPVTGSLSQQAQARHVLLNLVKSTDPDPEVFPVACDATLPKPEDPHQVLFNGESLLSSGIPMEALTQADLTPLHIVGVCDTSGSTVSESCSEASLSWLFRYWVAQGAAQAPGATLTVLHVGPNRERTREAFSVRVPVGEELGYRLAYLHSAGRELEQWAKAEHALDGSAILESITVASIVLKERQQGRRLLVVLSDLRQASRKHNFRKPNLLKSLRKRALVPELTDTTVLVCGVHNQTPDNTPFTAKDHQQLRAFFDAYWKATGTKAVHTVSACNATTIPLTSPIPTKTPDKLVLKKARAEK